MGGHDFAAATAPPAPSALGVRQLTALMFSDIVGYTALMGADETRAVEARERHRQVMQEFALRFRGRWVEEIGDESFTTFPSALDAVHCAKAVQVALEGAGDLRLRFGIHMGDVLEREGRLFGDAVNVAARIRALAEPGAIVVSERVWEDVRNHPEVGGRLLGSKRLKNVDHAVRIYVLTGAESTSGVRWRWLAGGVLIATVLAALVLWRLVPVASARPASIAVLPFANISADAANEYFADGMTEELLHALAQIENLKVPSRTSVFIYKNQPKDIRVIGRELDVQTVLEGSVRKDGGMLRITAQLVNVADGYHLWSQTYERRAQDLFAVQNELAQAIVAKLRPHVLPAAGRRLVQPGTANLEAYDLYLRGRFDYWRQDRSANERSIALLRRATEVDPEFARAHASLAQAYGNWIAYVEPKDASAATAGVDAANRALSLDPSLAEAYLARARMHFAPTGNFAFEPALQDLKRAVEYAPQLADAWAQISNVLNHLGLLDAAERAVERARELNPDSAGIRLQRAVVDLYTDRHERSLEWAETVPRDFNPTVWYAVTMYDLLRLNRLPDAAARYDEFQRKHPDEGGLLSAMSALRRALDGRTAGFDADVQNALTNRSPFGHFHHIAYQLAEAHAVAGRLDEAMGWLEQAAADGFPSYHGRRKALFLRNLHGQPRFERHLEKVRMQTEALRPLADSLPW